MKLSFYLALGFFIAFVSSIRFANSGSTVVAIFLGVAAVLALSALGTRSRV